MMKKFKFLGLLSVFSLLFTCFGYCQTTGFTKGVEQTRANNVVSLYDGLTNSYQLNNPLTLVNNTNSIFKLCFSVSCLNDQTQYSYFWSSNLKGIVYTDKSSSNMGCLLIYPSGTPNISSDIIFDSNSSCYVNVSSNIMFNQSDISENYCKTTYSLISPSEVSTEVKFLESEYTSTSYYLGYNKLATINLNGNSYTVSQINGDYTFNIQENQGGQCTGEISTGLSTLYINDIRHQSMPFIYVNIPEEFNWDYSTGINDFTIDISGYNVDTDYIAGIIDTQNYKPDESDFNKIITDVIPLFVPGLVIILFLYFVFRLIKKIF